MRRDQLLLFLSGVVCAVAAWAFWRYLGMDAVGVLMILALVSSLADNLRLRRKLRESNRGDGT